MRKYVIFVDSIINMGGSQQYCRNKVVYYKKIGFDVKLISSYKGKVYIEELKCFKNNIISQLRYSPFCFTKKEQKRVINSIFAFIGTMSKDDIIDSSSINCSEWAEIIAKQVGCKSILFAVDERFNITKDEFKYLYFKLQQKSLFTTSPDITKQMFARFVDLEKDSLLFFNAACSNVVDNVPDFYADSITDEHKILGCFGRLDKGYVMRTAIGFKQYATIHQECEFAFVFIGGGTKKTIKKRIYKLFRGLKNVKCIITDYIFPVPRSLLKKLDICIASSGCAETCLQERVPTIYVNSSNGLPIGIAGFTLDIYNFDFRFATPPKECENLESMLNHMLFEKDYRAFDPIYTSNKIETNEEIEKTFMDQYLFIKEANVLSYYPIDLIHPNGFKQRLYSFFGKCLGINFLSFMHLKVLHTFKTFKRK